MRSFYQIIPSSDRLVDVWLTPDGAESQTEKVPDWQRYKVRVLAVCGVDLTDPQWDGNLEEHIRKHYQNWVDSAEEIEL